MYSSPLSPAGLPFLLWREAGFRLRNVFSGSRAAWAQALGRNFREAAQVRQLRRLYGVTSFLFLDHQLCHAASAYFTPPFERALVLTLDERGDMRSGSLYLGEGDELRLLRPLRFPNSLGWFYSCVTELLGFRARRDEHKVQWLSKDGQPEFVPAFRELFRWDSDGLPVLNTRYLGSSGEEDSGFSGAVLRDLRLDSRVIASDPRLRASLARSARDFIEEIVLTIAERYRNQHSVDSLCVAGGLFLNVFLVRALETCGSFKQVHAQPVAGNSGTALGAALLARKRIGRPARQPYSISTLALVSPPGRSRRFGKYPSGEEQLLAEAAQVLSRDKIVAWFRGRTEFGHRALGNRSILASPFSEYVIENVNHYIKHREDFHPFAFSAPAEAPRACSTAPPIAGSWPRLASSNPRPRQACSAFLSRTAGCAFTPSAAKPTRASGACCTSSASALLLPSSSMLPSIFLGSRWFPTRAKPSAVFIAPPSTPSPSATS